MDHRELEMEMPQLHIHTYFFKKKYTLVSELAELVVSAILSDDEQALFHQIWDWSVILKLTIS